MSSPLHRSRRVAIRVDASRAIGWGHVKRCLALAEALRAAGAEVRFLARATDVDAAALLAGHDFECLAVVPTSPALSASGSAPTVPHAHWLDVTPARDAADTLAALGGWCPDVLVVDHYAIAASWHDALRRATGAAIAAIDDLADRPLAVDLVLDHNPSPDHRAKYRAVVDSGVTLLGGPAYALIDAVYRRQAKRAFHETVQRVGIFLGGTDPGQHSPWVLRACREHAGWRGPLQLATTSSSVHLDALRAECARDSNLEILIDQPNLAAFHVGHDLQIGAGGGALWERCALGVPTLALVCAANQRLSVPLLAEAGIVAGFDALEQSAACQAELGTLIARLIASGAERARLRERSLTLVDGRGAERAAAAILALAPPTEGARR